MSLIFQKSSECVGNDNGELATLEKAKTVPGLEIMLPICLMALPGLIQNIISKLTPWKTGQ